jgi:hypothetical protein
MIVFTSYSKFPEWKISGDRIRSSLEIVGFPLYKNMILIFRCDEGIKLLLKDHLVISRILETVVKEIQD